MSSNQTIWIIAEGDTERAAAAHLKQFLDNRAGDKPKVRLRVIRQDGGLKERAVRGDAANCLRDQSTVGVIALTDIYPEFKTAQDAEGTVQSWLPDDPRCFAAVAAHDFEAWLLADWAAVIKRAGVNQKAWGARPESINTGNPPAHRLKGLFQLCKPKQRSYRKPVDGKLLFDQLDLEQAAQKCPMLCKFLNCLLRLAGYPLLECAA